MKNFTKSLIYALTAATGASGTVGCSNDIPTVSLGIDDVYYVCRMQKLHLKPEFTGSEYRWTDAQGNLLSSSAEYIFLQAEPGRYPVTLDIVDPATPYHFEFVINVLEEEVAYSPYISEVYEYCPAPGQFINILPQYNEGDTPADMVRKAGESISGTNDVLVSLGGFGGYVTFGFDHTVMNFPGEPDFKILGNCVYEATGAGGDRPGGSAEPGIVMVSLDVNGNGLPDDPWYEIPGSAHTLPATKHNYTITYHRPVADHPVIVDGTVIDRDYIAWSDSEGQQGYMSKIAAHTQDYFPKWISDDRLSFTGTCLPPNAVDRYGNGRYFILYSYDWGYVDNHPNQYSDLISFDISAAVDADGMPAALPGVDFVRVYTGVNQQCGWIGETSTEISRAVDLHVDDPNIFPAAPLSVAGK